MADLRDRARRRARRRARSAPGRPGTRWIDEERRDEQAEQHHEAERQPVDEVAHHRGCACSSRVAPRASRSSVRRRRTAARRSTCPPGGPSPSASIFGAARRCAEWALMNGRFMTLIDRRLLIERLLDLRPLLDALGVSVGRDERLDLLLDRRVLPVREEPVECRCPGRPRKSAYSSGTGHVAGERRERERHVVLRWPGSWPSPVAGSVSWQLDLDADRAQLLLQQQRRAACSSRSPTGTGSVVENPLGYFDAAISSLAFATSYGYGLTVLSGGVVFRSPCSTLLGICAQPAEDRLVHLLAVERVLHRPAHVEVRKPGLLVVEPQAHEQRDLGRLHAQVLVGLERAICENGMPSMICAAPLRSARIRLLESVAKLNGPSSGRACPSPSSSGLRSNVMCEPLDELLDHERPGADRVLVERRALLLDQLLGQDEGRPDARCCRGTPRPAA